jgi:hypothetical protein
MSTISSIGLEGVSSNTNAVGRDKAVRQAARSPASTKVRHDPMARAEQRPAGHNMVPAAQVAHQRGMHRGHARGGGTASLSTFHQREAAFQCGYCRIAEARILVVEFRAREGGGRLLGTVVDKAARQEHRLAGLAIGRAVDAAVDQRCRLVVII